jgi:DNA-directed RNA polymerase specialized sigma24 family protein
MGRPNVHGCEETEGVLLTQWGSLIVATLRNSAYRESAEDVAQEKILGMIRKARSGRPFPPCPPRLSQIFRKEILRIARRLSSGPNVGSVEWEAVEDPNSDERETLADRGRIQLLRLMFSETAIRRMEEEIRLGHYRHEDLARAVEMPLRTFDSWLKELRVARPS